MTYVITQACVDVLDKACIDECPVDCIYEGDRMLYIHPDECVDCGACEPVCPVEAIYYEDDVPDKWKDFYNANVEFFSDLGSPGGAAKTGQDRQGPPAGRRPAAAGAKAPDGSARAAGRGRHALPDFPWDSLAGARARAAQHPDGVVDLSIGTPVDDTPAVLSRALAAAGNAPGYPTALGTPRAADGGRRLAAPSARRRGGRPARPPTRR